MEKDIKKTDDPKGAPNPLSIGATIEGKVVARDRSSLYIDLGIYGTGIIYGRFISVCVELESSILAFSAASFKR